MKKLIRILTIVAVLVATICCLSACKTWDLPYTQLSQDGYDVTVRYDTTGGKVSNIEGTFITDVYTSNGKELNSDGTVDITLYHPEDPIRGLDEKGNPKYKITKDDHELIGWYTHRELRFDKDGNALDEYGQLCSESGRAQGYIYSGYWDFENKTLKVNPDEKTPEGEYTLTLYAAWAPKVTYDIYYTYVEYDDSDFSSDNFEYYSSVDSLKLEIPNWNNNGIMTIKGAFPNVDSSATFKEASLTPDFANKLELGQNVPGSVDLETGTLNLDGNSVRVYTKWLRGAWFKVTRKAVLTANAKKGNESNNFIIDCDINFGSKLPEAFSGGEFNGQIIGNGHKFTNIRANQTGEQGGIFYAIGSNAKITDLTFENVTYTMNTGATKSGNSYGVLAGKISSDATFENVEIKDAKLVLNPDMNSDPSVVYSIGLLCGNIVETGLDISGISCEVLENEYASCDIIFTVDDDAVGTVTITFIERQQ